MNLWPMRTFGHHQATRRATHLTARMVRSRGAMGRTSLRAPIFVRSQMQALCEPSPDGQFHITMLAIMNGMSRCEEWAKRVIDYALVEALHNREEAE